MRKILTICCVVVVALLGNAQQQHMLFNKVWGPTQNNFYSSLAFADQLGNGDFFLVGNTTELFDGYHLYYACRTDSTGAILWEQTWGTPDVTNGITKVIKGYDNSYIVIARGSEGSGVSHFCISKLNAEGNISFCRYYYFGYDDFPSGITKTNDSSYVICGTRGTGPGTGYPALLKIDQDGNEIWRRTYSSLANYYLQEIRETDDSGFVAIGKSVGLQNCFYVKYDVNGMMEWIKYPFGTVNSFINNLGDIRLNSDGSFDIYYKTVLQGNPPHVITGILEHYNSEGDSMWAVNFIDTSFLFVTVASEDSLFYFVGGDFRYYRLSESFSFELLVSPSVPGALGYIPTRDGCFLGYGEFDDASSNCKRFQITKYGPDNRYQAGSFLSQLNVFPNPALAGNVTASFDVLTDENVQVQVWSIDGRLIYTDEIFCPANSHTELPIHLDAATANAGTYILEIRTSGEYRRQLIMIGRDDD